MSNNTTQKKVYDKNGNLIESDYSTNGVVTEKDFYTGGILSEKDYLSGNTITEKDYLNSKGVITEKDYLTNGTVTEKDYLTNGVVFEKFYFTNNKCTEIDLFTKGSLSGKDYYTYDKNGNLIEADYYTSNGTLTEKAYYANNRLTEADLYTNGSLSEKDYYTNNNLTEADLFTNGSLSGKNLYTYDKNGKLTEEDSYNSSGTISQKVFYNNNTITEIDGYISGAIAQKVYYNSSGSEVDSYRNGIISQKYYYDTNYKMTQVDFLTNGLISERVHYNSNNSVTERDYFNTNGSSNGKSLYTFNTNGKLTEEDYYNSKGILTEKDYFNANGIMTQNNYYDSTGNLVTNQSGLVTTDPINQKVIDYGQNNQWANYLDYSQGDNDKKYVSDCGLVSCENVLIQEGILPKESNYSPSISVKNGEWVYKSYNDTDESKVVDYAAANGLITGISNSDPYYNGGTSMCQMWDILNNFDVPANEYDTSLTQIANAIKNNEGVIAAVDANILWGGTDPGGQANHAVTITGVAYDYTNPNQIDGFYICDSGAGMAAGIKDANEFVPYSLMASSFDLLDSNTIGVAIITDTAKQTLSSTVSSPVGVSSNTMNNIIQQMAGFKTGADLEAIASVNNNSQRQDLQALLASHTA